MSEDLATNLKQFTGSERLYRHSSRCLQYTEGIKYLAEQAEAFWLIDAIASYQREPQIREDPMLRDFQLWILATNLEAHSAVLSCYRDTDDPAFSQQIEYTNFPLAEIKLYVCNSVLLLPSEY